MKTFLSFIALAALISGCSPQPVGQSNAVHVAAREAATTQPDTPSALERRAAMAATAINPRVAGAEMLGTRTIASNVAAAPNLRALARALDASDAGHRLSAAGPVTVFAPSDEAFARMSPEVVNELLLPQNRATLNKMVNGHVVPGVLTLEELRARIDRSGGVARLPTLDGATLLAKKEGAAVALTDTYGNKSYVETPDVQQRDGVFHVINGVIVPRLA